MKHLYTVNNANGHTIVIVTTLEEAKRSKENLEEFHREKFNEEVKFTINKFWSNTGKHYCYDETIK